MVFPGQGAMSGSDLALVPVERNLYYFVEVFFHIHNCKLA